MCDPDNSIPVLSFELWTHYALTECTCSKFQIVCKYNWQFPGIAHFWVDLHISKYKLQFFKYKYNSSNTWLMAMLANRLSRLVSEAAFPRLSSSFHATTPFWNLLNLEIMFWTLKNLFHKTDLGICRNLVLSIENNWSEVGQGLADAEHLNFRN